MFEKRGVAETGRDQGGDWRCIKKSGGKNGANECDNSIDEVAGRMSKQAKNCLIRSVKRYERKDVLIRGKRKKNTSRSVKMTTVSLCCFNLFTILLDAVRRRQ